MEFFKISVSTSNRSIARQYRTMGSGNAAGDGANHLTDFSEITRTVLSPALKVYEHCAESSMENKTREHYQINSATKAVLDRLLLRNANEMPRNITVDCKKNNEPVTLIYEIKNGQVCVTTLGTEDTEFLPGVRNFNDLHKVLGNEFKQIEREKEPDMDPNCMMLIFDALSPRRWPVNET